jgi:hypothetical protein
MNNTENTACFQIGSTHNYAGLYGGWYSLEVVDRSSDTVTMRSSWIAEDTGRLCHSNHIYQVEVEDICGTPVERICVWGYHGSKGYVYALDEDQLLALYDNDEKEYEDYDDGYYEEDYGPSNPWDAPGMKVSDFITGVYPF